MTNAILEIIGCLNQSCNETDRAPYVAINIQQSKIAVQSFFKEQLYTFKRRDIPLNILLVQSTNKSEVSEVVILFLICISGVSIFDL